MPCSEGALSRMRAERDRRTQKGEEIRGEERRSQAAGFEDRRGEPRNVGVSVQGIKETNSLLRAPKECSSMDTL